MSAYTLPNPWRTLLFVAVAVGVAAAPLTVAWPVPRAEAGNVVTLLFDGTMADSNWTWKQLNPAIPSSVLGYQPSGGNPGSYRLIRHKPVPGYVKTGTLNKYVAEAVDPSDIDLSDVEQFTMSIDSYFEYSGSGNQLNVGVTVYQGSSFYRKNITVSGKNKWISSSHPVTPEVLKAAGFDLSENGQPIYFGFLSGHSQVDSNKIRFDNFKVVASFADHDHEDGDSDHDEDGDEEEDNDNGDHNGDNGDGDRDHGDDHKHHHKKDRRDHKNPTPTPTPTPTPSPTEEPEEEEDKTTDITITKTDKRSITRPGHTVTYTITVENSGEVDVHDLTIVDSVPTALLVMNVSEGGKVLDHSVEWSNIAIGAGETKTFTVTAKVKEDTPNGHQLRNVATVTSDDHGLHVATDDITVVETAPAVAAAQVTAVPVPVSAKTGAGTIGLILTALGGSGLAISLRRYW